MIHLESPFSRARGRRIWSLGLVSLAMLCLATTYQTNHWINEQFQRDDIPVAAADAPAKLAGASYDALPIVLTTPMAVAQAQHMAVARAKHDAAIKDSNKIRQIPGLKGAGGLIAGLALLQAMHSHGGH